MRRRKPIFAHAGTWIHDEILKQFRNQRINQDKVELRTKEDYQIFRNNGFSVERSIKDVDGNSVKVHDDKNGKIMTSIPDFVDYVDDLICDIKTVHIHDPPDEGGFFVTEEMDVKKVEIPEDYEDATGELYGKAMEKIKKQYVSQFKRYKEAYKQATGRDPELYIYPIIYAPTKQELLRKKGDKRPLFPTYVGKIE